MSAITGKVTARGLAAGSMWANVAEVARLGSRFLLVPFLLKAVGLEGYGTWLLLVALYSWVTVPSSGFAMACTKLTAELDRRGDIDELSAVVGAGMTMLTLTMTLALAVGWLGRSWLLPALGVPAALLAPATTALALLGVTALLRAGPGCALPVLAGLQRLDLRHRLDAVEAMVFLVLAVVLLAAGLGLIALALAVLGGQLLVTAAALLLCRRLRPELAFSPLRTTRSGLRRVFALSVRFQALLAVSASAGSGLRMIISALAGVDALAVYHLADRLTTLARLPASSVFMPLLAAFANLASPDDAARRHVLVREASKLALVTALVPLSFVCLLADPLLVAWTGAHHANAVWTTRALALPTVAIVLASVPAISLRGAGRFRLEFSVRVTEVVLLLIGSWAAFLAFGYAGIVAATTIVPLASHCWLLWRFSQRFEPGLTGYLARATLRGGLALIPGSLLLAFVAASLFPAEVVLSRWALLPRLALLAGLHSVAAGLLGWMLVFTAQERRALIVRFSSPIQPSRSANG